MSNYVIDTILKHSMIKQLQTEYLGVFKKQFMAQMALSSFLSATFHLGGRSPTKTLFAKNSGKVLQLDFHPLYTPVRACASSSCCSPISSPRDAPGLAERRGF